MKEKKKLKEMEEFLDPSQSLKLKKEEISNLSRPPTNMEKSDKMPIGE